MGPSCRTDTLNRYTKRIIPPPREYCQKATTKSYFKLFRFPKIKITIIFKETPKNAFLLLTMVDHLGPNLPSDFKWFKKKRLAIRK